MGPGAHGSYLGGKLSAVPSAPRAQATSGLTATPRQSLKLRGVPWGWQQGAPPNLVCLFGGRRHPVVI